MSTSLPFKIIADHISVSRNGQMILNDISWEIREDQNWAVTGPNGAGKSVLMQVIQGFLPSSEGRMQYTDGVRKRIAHVSFELHHRLIAHEQDHEIFREFAGNQESGLTVRHLLEDGLGNCDEHMDSPLQSSILQGALQRGSSGWGNGRDDDIVRMMGMDRFQDAPIITLSNGEMRKALIARAMLGAPRILILDEPYDGLDSSACRQLTDIMHHLPQMGVQIILATHHMDEIPDIVTHMLCLDAHGHVTYQGEKTGMEIGELNRTRVAVPVKTPLNTVEKHSDEVPNALPFETPPAPVLTADPAAPPTIVMKDVTIVYGARVVLDKLNWVVQRNENWAVVGPNGAGKSTLLSLVSADNPQAYANEISLFGRPRGSGESIWDIKRRIGMISPELQIRYRENISVLDVVLSGFFDSVGLYRHAAATQRQSARYWLEFLGIDSLTECDYNLLSYGQKRLVLLARALVKSPQLLLLDEPCQGLDDENRRRLIQTVSRVSRDAGIQVVFVTHRLNEIPDGISHILDFQRNETTGICTAHQYKWR